MLWVKNQSKDSFQKAKFLNLDRMQGASKLAFSKLKNLLQVRYCFRI